MIVTFVAIVLMTLLDPITVIVGLGAGALLKRRALVEPVALGAAIVVEILLVLAMPERGINPMVLAARGLVTLLYAHIAHLFVHGWTPIEDDDKPLIDAKAAEYQDRVLLRLLDWGEALRGAKRRNSQEVSDEGR